MNKLVHRLLLLVALSLLAGPVAAQSTLTPANGWWWTKQVPDSGTRYALQFSPDLSSLYGVAATFRDDGSPVWYVINANNAADANTGSGKAAPPSGATSAGAAGSRDQGERHGFRRLTFSGSAASMRVVAGWQAVRERPQGFRRSSRTSIWLPRWQPPLGRRATEPDDRHPHAPRSARR
jgi:hypothetical protein